MASSRKTAPARRTEKSGVMRFAARVGFAASGVVHILIGFLAIEVAAGAGVKEADQSGALAQLAATPGGIVVLWIAVVGFAALGLWLIIKAFLGTGGARGKRARHFLTDFSRGVVYLVLALTAYSFANGGGTSSATSTSTASGDLLARPGGGVVVGLVGVGVFAVGVYLLVKGLSRSFTKDLRLPGGAAGRATVALGIAGYVAKAVALGAVGVLFVIAALTGDAAKANGLDQGLKGLAALPFGGAILVAVGIGLIAYGAYSFVRARYAKL